MAASACARVMIALLGHPVEDVVAALEGPLGIRVGRIDRRPAEDPRDERRFLETEVRDALAEIEVRGRLDAVGAVAEVELVAVQLEDPLLGILLLDAAGDEHLLELPPDGLLGIEEQLAGQLLGDGAPALGAAERAAPDPDDVLLERPDDAHVIDALVRIEPGVLGGDDGLLQDVGNARVRDFDPPLLGELLDDVALVGQDRGDDLGPEVLELVDRREVVPDGHVGAEHGAQGAGRADGQHDEQDAEPSRLPQLADPDLQVGIFSLRFGILILSRALHGRTRQI